MFLQSAFKGCGMKISTLGLKQDILRANFIPENGLLRLKKSIFRTILYKYQQDSLVTKRKRQATFGRRLREALGVA
jgi:hypothetical protein